jgi:(p)ppGpp synthase/HD superfamily hydrolase
MKLYEAIHTIMKAHQGQIRKLDGDPYAVHPIEVSLMVSKWGADESVVIAALLHDVVEDTIWTLDEVAAQFGSDVAALVAFCSEYDKSQAWSVRKQAMIEKVNQPGNLDAKLIILADKLCNLKSIARSLEDMDESDVWSSFNAPKEDQYWYYREISHALKALESNPLCREDYGLLMRMIEKIFNTPL